LPDVIIIGAQKAGTTSLFDYLGQHPQLLPSMTKEVHFFDGGLDPAIDTYHKGTRWYKAHFPLKDRIAKGFKTFEASPLYLFNPLVPKRIKALLPNVKLIAVLRHPSERAISHYFHEKRKGRETLSLREALAAEDQRIAPAIERQDYKNMSFIHHSYKARGLYRDQLATYLDIFSNEQLLVVASEDLFTSPVKTLRQIFEFIGVDADYTVPDVSPKHVSTNRHAVEPGVYAELDAFFQPHNQALYQLMGTSYGW
jgi:hypothetical protein